MRIRHFLLLIILGCFVGAAPAFSQEDLDAIYTAPDDSFEFLYPSDWEVEDSEYEDSGFVSLFGEIGRETVSLSFLGPVVVDAIAPRADDVEEVSEGITEIFEIEDFEILDADGRDLGIGFLEADGTSLGLIFIIEFSDEGFGAVLASGESDDSFEDEDFFGTVASIVVSFNNVGENGVEAEEGEEGEEGEGRETSSGEFPDELRDFDGAWQDAVAELEDEGVVASGGTLIFNENRAFFDGVGAWFTRLSRNTPRRDIVMAATLSFTTDSRDYESCAIMARIQDTGGDVVDTFLEIGINNDGQAFWTDASGGDFDSDTADLDLDLDEPHNILFVAQLDRLWIYVDGELVFDNVRIEERTGYFGISLIGAGADSRCEGTNIWAYDAPAFVAGLCEAVASGTVNKRSGPGTDFDRAGTMAGGERIEVIGQAEDSAGFTWYELDDDSWVREDVISLQGDCGDIPESD